MRKMLLSLLCAVPLLTGAAFAASDSGTVSSANARTGMLRLADGVTYYVPNRGTFSWVRPGDAVSIDYDRTADGRVANEVSRIDSGESTISPVKGEAVRKNFVNGKSTMCDATADEKNPCYIGAQ